MSDDTTYNGWKNYPTWNVKLWLDNDEFHYRSLAEVIPTIGDEYMASIDYTRPRAHVVADYVKDYVEENFDNPETGMLADLYGWALGQVDWDEIGAAYASDHPYQGDPDDE